eukprot:scaffold132601_cov75-Phaeocystis_antarctica.AAC.4
MAINTPPDDRARPHRPYGSSLPAAARRCHQASRPRVAWRRCGARTTRAAPDRHARGPRTARLRQREGARRRTRTARRRPARHRSPRPCQPRGSCGRHAPPGRRCDASSPPRTRPQRRWACAVRCAGRRRGGGAEGAGG